MMECPDCMENGMVQCECTLGSPQHPPLLDRLTECESPSSSPVRGIAGR